MSTINPLSPNPIDGKSAYSPTGDVKPEYWN
jgi:hypothetical protein